jgi:probable F420-dependent oxidoreductase
MKIRLAVAPESSSQQGAGLVAFGDALEASAFDAVWLSDRPVDPTFDPLLGLALIAGRTSRLKLGANIVPLGRHPFLLAKGLAQLDQLSGGRLLLSFVTGLDQPGERELLRLEGAGRGAVLEEVLGLLRAWWSGEAVEHRSARWTISGLASAARPAQDPLEVWLGGRGPRALERVGRLADGWLGAMVTPAEASVARAQIQTAAQRAGREIDPEHFGLSIGYVRGAPGEQTLRGLRARREDVDPLELLGVGARSLRSLIGRHIDGGLSKFVLRPIEAVTSWEDELEWLAGAVADLQTC